MRTRPGSWRLFWAIALLLSLVNCYSLATADFHTEKGTVPAILLAVRCALPFFLVAFTASSVARLWPSRVTGWILANRRYFGLAFAFGMAWHLSFVAYSLCAFGDHLGRVVNTLDFTGLAFLLALTLTSFQWAKRRMSPKAWRRLHKTGVYVIWLLATYIYYEFAKGDRDLFDFAALGVMLAAWLLRFTAWRNRHMVTMSSSSS